jgi:hypothetical protein
LKAQSQQSEKQWRLPYDVRKTSDGHDEYCFLNPDGCLYPDGHYGVAGGAEMKISVYLSKGGAEEGLPWVIITSKGNFPASSVDFLVKSFTEERTNRITEPKFFICCHGDIEWSGKKAIIREERRK